MLLFHPRSLLGAFGICLIILGFLVKENDARRRSLSSRHSHGHSKLMRGSSKLARPPSSNSRSSKRKSKKSPKKHHHNRHRSGRGKMVLTGLHVQIGIHQPKKPTCPKESVEMNCLSCRTKVYRECPIEAAYKIEDVYVINEYPQSHGTCSAGGKKNFGIINGNSIWVNFGCRAKFLVCYDKGTQEKKTVDCLAASSRHSCPMKLGRSDHLNEVSVLWSFGSGKCKQNKTWGIDGADIWVEGGCSATFTVTFN